MNNEAKVIPIDSVPRQSDLIELDKAGSKRVLKALFPDTEAEQIADLVEVLEAVTSQIEALARTHSDSLSLHNAARYAHPLLHALRQYEQVINPLSELPF